MGLPLPSVNLWVTSELIRGRLEDFMSTPVQLPTWRNPLAATAAAGALGLHPGTLRAASGEASLRHFRVGEVPEFVEACHACHTIAKERDFIWTHYPKR